MLDNKSYNILFKYQIAFTKIVENDKLKDSELPYFIT